MVWCLPAPPVFADGRTGSLRKAGLVANLRQVIFSQADHFHDGIAVDTVLLHGTGNFKGGFSLAFFNTALFPQTVRYWVRAGTNLAASLSTSNSGGVIRCWLSIRRITARNAPAAVIQPEKTDSHRVNSNVRYADIPQTPISTALATF